MEYRKNGLRKGSWTEAEDKLLRKCIDKYGEGKWHQVPLRAGLNRCRKSCRLRWLNYLRPNIKRGQFAADEVDLISRMHKLLGNRWSLIAGRLPGRTANDIKNFWNTHSSKKPVLEKVSSSNSDGVDKTPSNPTERKLLVKPQALTFSKSSVWIKQRTSCSMSDYEHPSSGKEMITTKSSPEFPNREEATSPCWWENILPDHLVTANTSTEGKNTTEDVKSSDFDDFFLDENLWALLEVPE